MYGGAAGGGKSEALLMGALQFVDVPGYTAILFRRTYVDLMLPEALMDRSITWLMGTKARWNAKDCVWTFPSGARVLFGYLKHENDKYRYQSAEFQFIGLDEVTQFTRTQYLYMFSRLRRLTGVYVPLRMRCASNPGGVGHDWVKERFIPWYTCMECGEHQQIGIIQDFYRCHSCGSLDITIEYTKGRVFVPATLEDNPNLDIASYVKNLDKLDPVTRRQLKLGDWTARHGGMKFQREWFEIVDQAPMEAARVRYWDMASTTAKEGEDPDWTCGALLALQRGVYYLEDIIRKRLTPQGTENLVKQTAQLDHAKYGHSCRVYMEEEPGSAGKAQISHYSRNVLVGFTFRGHRTTGSKEVRANPVSSAAEAGNIKLVSGRWNADFLDEAEAFPIGAHDDQIDAVSGGFEVLRGARATARFLEW